MIKANVISGHSNWKKNLKNPDNYLKKRLKVLSKVPFFKKKIMNFQCSLPITKK